MSTTELLLVAVMIVSLTWTCVDGLTQHDCPSK